nr:uncharacterized protein LOC108009424 [Drosophila suzukii]
MQLIKYVILLFVFCGVLMPIEIVARTVDSERQFERASAITIRHIQRSPRVPVPEMPLDFQTKHAPCDMDSRGRQSYIHAFPNHCIWAYNNRYLSEGHFRIYKTYQLEAFFFGQYYERLKRYEFEPHVYDYNM